MGKKTVCSILLPLLSVGLSAIEKPNVLFIAIDDLNDWVGCLNGHPQTKTPNIDRLATQGILFTNAHCQAPISGPSRASIMTGLYPSTSGNYFQLNDNDIKKSNHVTSKASYLNDYFKMNGYTTIGAGKIFHLGDGDNSFEEYAGMFAGYGPNPQKRFKYDPAWFSNRKGKTATDWAAYPEHDSLLTDYQLAEWTASKLKMNYEKPFFMAVGFIRPHVPWYVTKKWYDMFPLKDIITPPYKPDDYNDIPEMGYKVTAVPMMPDTEWLIETNQWKELVQAYLACIAFVDAQVGKVLDALENSAYAKNTIVVLWSDHGYHLGEKNRVAKQSLWERSTRVPLIFKIPGINQSSVCDKPVQLIDMYPTLAALCGLPRPMQTDGNSLDGLIRNPDEKWKHKALSFFGEGNVSVRDERYRLIQYEDGSLELYDIMLDPNEWNNLANDSGYKNIIRKLQRAVPKKMSEKSAYTFINFHEHFNR